VADGADIDNPQNLQHVVPGVMGRWGTLLRLAHDILGAWSEASWRTLAAFVVNKRCALACKTCDGMDEHKGSDARKR